MSGVIGTRYTRDGGIKPSGVPSKKRSNTMDQHINQFALYKGMVVDVIYPEDKRNTNGQRTEYRVKIKGQLYDGVTDVRKSGAIYNNSERIKTRRRRALRGKFDHNNFDENLDGEPVYCLFLEGNGDRPVIIGSAPHPEHHEYRKFTAEDGDYDFDEYNGIEFLIDKNSNYTIKHVGRKNENGVVQNSEAVDSQIKFYGNGDIEFDTHGTGGTSDLRMRLTKADKKAEIYAQENKFMMNASGVSIEDKNGNSATMNSAGVTVTDLSSNSVTMTSAGTTISDSNSNTITMASGSVTIEESGGKKFVAGTKQTLGAGGQPIILGTAFNAALSTYLAVESAIIPGTVIQNAAALTAIKAAATALSGALSATLSTNSETD